MSDRTCGLDQLMQQGSTNPAAAIRGVDVHALDLGRAGADPPHAGGADPLVVIERQQEATIRRLELGDARRSVQVDVPVAACGEVPSTATATLATVLLSVAVPGHRDRSGRE